VGIRLVRPHEGSALQRHTVPGCRRFHRTRRTPPRRDRLFHKCLLPSARGVAG
jgi:hypothetical protein